jgi:hypothetical protein
MQFRCMATETCGRIKPGFLDFADPVHEFPRKDWTQQTGFKTLERGLLLQVRRGMSQILGFSCIHGGYSWELAERATLF